MEDYRDSMFSGAVRQRIDFMQSNADRLFLLGWLRKRLWSEFQTKVSDCPSTEYGDFRHVVQGSYDSCFVWEYVSTYRSSLAAIKRILDNSFDDENPLFELIEERKRQIEDFAKMPYSNRFDALKNDDASWRAFARRLPFDDVRKRGEIHEFFLKLDNISIMTDIICRHAKDYSLEVDYSCIDDYEAKQMRAQLTDERLAAALRTEEAEAVWDKLRKAGFIVANGYALAEGVSANQATYIAACMSDKLGFWYKWKYFQQLWGISNMAQLAKGWQQTGKLPPRSREIDKLTE